MLGQALNCSPQSLKLADVNFQGNIIPSTWFGHIRFDSGKADLLAINILSDIVYWYRPVAVRDEQSGAFIGWRQKFKHDWLYVNPHEMADRFGCSVRQIKAALLRLQHHNLIQRRSCQMTLQGMTLSHLLFIELNADQVIATTQRQVPRPVKPQPEPDTNIIIDDELDILEHGQIIACTLSDVPGQDQSHDSQTSGPLHSNVTPLTSQCRVYIEAKSSPQITTQTDDTGAGAREVNSGRSVGLSSINQNLFETKLFKSKQPGLASVKPLPDQPSHQDLQTISATMIAIWNQHFYQQIPLSQQQVYAGRLESLLQQVFKGDIQRWQAYCQQIAATPFLCGQGPKGWKASFDWCLNIDNARKVLQGTYQPKSSVALTSNHQTHQTNDNQPDPQALKLELQQNIAHFANANLRQFHEYLLQNCEVYTYRNWFAELSLNSCDGQRLSLTAPSQLIAGYCNGRYASQLQQAAQHSFGVKCCQVKVAPPSPTSASVNSFDNIISNNITSNNNTGVSS